MKIHLFLVADPYNTKGWSVLTIEGTDTWAIDHNDEREDAFLLKVIDLPNPNPSDLVQIGLAKVEEMKSEMAGQAAMNNQRVKEFESKFLSLDAPEVDVTDLS